MSAATGGVNTMKPGVGAEGQWKLGLARRGASPTASAVDHDVAPVTSIRTQNAYLAWVQDRVSTPM
jgi:hypothetical protein